jgi:hypothetical protein
MSARFARLREFFGRVWQWFWRSDAIFELRRTTVAASPRTRELYRRARLSDELARRLLARRRPERATDSAHACELFRQGVTWLLCALRSADSEDASGAAEEVTLEALWAGPARTTLALAVADEASLAAAEPLLLNRSFVDYAELPGPEQRQTAVALRDLVRRWLAAVEAPQLALDKIHRRRSLHVTVLLFVVAALVILGTVGAERQEARLDLARGKPWKTSSPHLMFGCKSPDQTCPESPTFFFHTQEDDKPWVVIDLGVKSRFSSLRIKNRIGCCPERAVPLLVEVSNDQKKWKQVARREEPFDVWKPKFKPENARYVRVRAARKTWLHLSFVRVLP